VDLKILDLSWRKAGQERVCALKLKLDEGAGDFSSSFLSFNTTNY
jgi:hypothetical protein